MKKLLVVVCLVCGCVALPVQKASAQDPIALIIKQAIIKVIKAVDLKIQRLQNKTIWLQNAQKTLENKMSQLKLDEIKDWVEKQLKLYDDYFQELWKVKAALTYYQRVKDIIQRQIGMVREYKSAWALLKQDKNFTKEELDYMSNTYQGLINESLKNIDGLALVVNAFVTQMSDGKRLEIINAVSENLDKQFVDLKEFNNQNKSISLQRSAERGEIEYARRLYGLQ